MGWLILFVVIAVVGGFIKWKISQGGKAENARLRGYGIVVDGDTVKSGGRVLGPLAGATALVTDGTSRHTLTRVVTVVGAATKKTKAAVLVTTANGGINQQNIEGAGELRRAQAWVVRFNAMAAAEGQQLPQADPGGGAWGSPEAWAAPPSPPPGPAVGAPGWDPSAVRGRHGRREEEGYDGLYR